MGSPNSIVSKHYVATLSVTTKEIIVVNYNTKNFRVDTNSAVATLSANMLK